MQALLTPWPQTLGLYLAAIVSLLYFFSHLKRSRRTGKFVSLTHADRILSSSVIAAIPDVQSENFNPSLPQLAAGT